MASRRTYPVPNKNLSCSDYTQNKRAKQLFSGTSNLAKTIEQQNGNFPIVTPLGKLKPYQGTFGLSGRQDTPQTDKTYCLNTSHSYRDLLAITKGKYLLTPPNVSDQEFIKLQDVNDPTKLYNGIYYVYIYLNTTTPLYYMNPAYPLTPATYTANKIQYDVTGNANERIITDPSFILHYASQSCVLIPRLSQNVGINNDYDSRFSFNRTINLDLFSGFQYPIKFSLDYDSGDCINSSNDLQSKYAFPSIPFNISPPVISGSGSPPYVVGSVLTLTSDGTWGGSPVITFTYQWYRGSIEIPGAVNNTYTIVGSDIQQLITCEVTGTNSSGSSNASSNSITPSDPPVNNTAPIISGPGGAPPYSVGDTLSCSSGSWNGTPTPTYAYQWKKNGVAIPGPGATTSTYALVASDFASGTIITCQVTATNSSGTSLPATSSNSITPTGVPVINIPPSISGPVGAPPYSVGSILTTTNGTWYSSSSILGYAYQWKKNGVAIPLLSTSSTYALVASDFDLGTIITCQVTANNSSGSSSPETSSNSITPTGVPVINILPSISGTSPYAVGSILTLNSPGSPGTWYTSSIPLTYQYQWYRGTSPISPPQTGPSYTIAGPVGSPSITCQVTATNSTGTSSPATSSNSITPT
jgi:hypothetical protein